MAINNPIKFVLLFPCLPSFNIYEPFVIQGLSLTWDLCEGEKNKQYIQVMLV